MANPNNHNPNTSPLTITLTLTHDHSLEPEPLTWSQTLTLSHMLLPRVPYLTLCICNISGSVALSEATKLPTGMFSILVTVRGSGKKTGPSLMSRTVTWTVAVELEP